MNVATALQPETRSGLFTGSDDQINELSIAPPERGQLLGPEALRLVPTGWAELIVVDAGCFGMQPQQLWTELARIARRDALMVVVLPGSSQSLADWSSTEPLLKTIGGYVQSFGSETSPDSGRNLQWARRNARGYAWAAGSRIDLDRVGQRWSGLSGFIDPINQSLPDSSRSELGSPVSAKPVTGSISTSERLHKGGHLEDLEAIIAKLQIQLEDRRQAWEDIQAELASLQRNQTSLRMALSGNGSAIQIEEPQSTCSDLENELRSLRRQLSEMTVSYLEMRDNVHALINSGFWRITWLPRRLLDRLKASLRRSKRLLQPQLAEPVRLLKPQKVRDDADQPARSDQQVTEPASVEPLNTKAMIQTSQTDQAVPSSRDLLDKLGRDPSTWKQLWTGTFLTLNDNSTSGSQRRLDRILFVDWRLPEPDQDSGSCRIAAILEISVSLGLRVDFISDSANQKESYRDALLHLGIHVVEGRAEGLRHLQRFGMHYRQCFICRPEPAAFYFPLIRCYCPEAQLIYDTVDLHYSRFYRGSRLSGLQEDERAHQLRLHKHYKSAETFFITSADCIAVVTELEKQEIMTTIQPSCPVVVLPNIHTLADRSSLPTWQQRKDILFVGSFDHAPNLDAVIFFCEQILPLVTRELPDIVFHIVGSNMPDKIRRLQSPHINAIGYVEDLRQIFDRIRVFVAPLRYGAGLKGKVGQSMSYGVPVVGTNIAFEGFSIDDQQQGMIADEPQQFAKALIRTYSDKDLWKLLSSQAWDLIEERFSTRAVRKTLQAVLQTEA